MLGQLPESIRILLIISVIALSIIGCGGGSRGTGSVNIEGKVLASGSKQPVAGVTISSAETGQTSITDSDGFFRIEGIVIVIASLIRFLNDTEQD